MNEKIAINIGDGLEFDAFTGQLKTLTTHALPNPNRQSLRKAVKSAQAKQQLSLSTMTIITATSNSLEPTVLTYQAQHRASLLTAQS